MQKNFMLPIKFNVTQGTPFERLEYAKGVENLEATKVNEAELKSMLEEWQTIGL